MSTTGQRMYVARTTTAVATVAATTKTIVGVMGTAATTIVLRRFRISFASVTATDVPALVEVSIITALGTSTAFTPVQITGSTLASVCTAGVNHTVEPTPSRVFELTHVPVQQGLYDVWFPLGEEPQCDPSQGIAIKVTSPQAQSVHASLFYIE